MKGAVPSTTTLTKWATTVLTSQPVREARLCQFFLIQFSSQVSDLATFVGSRREDSLTIHDQDSRQRRLSRATFPAWYRFRCQESRRCQVGVTLRDLIEREVEGS